MSALKLKPTYKVVQAYYTEIRNLAQLSLVSEGAVSPAFAALLRTCAKQFDWTLAEQFSLKRGERTIRVDGALVDAFKLVHGVWEAKDTDDDLEKEVEKKFSAGYPKENILFQAPDRAIIYQDGGAVFDEDITQPERLVQALNVFFAYQPPEYERWQEAVEEFKLKVPEWAAGLLGLIERERETNKPFVRAFGDFTELCRTAINPNLSAEAVEEMLIQHILTERIFRKVFDNPEFLGRNVIAREIEKVVRALTARSFSQHEFLKPLDRFYGVIESTAATVEDFSQKQYFLNTVYEKFFQGFSVKVADTHGIVYTPQPIVDFMIRSVQAILQKEFGRSISDEGVHILDPFVGTGNFIVRMMREMRRSKLPQKYAKELHCNEVMLLPYYIASMNIEHEYYELTGEYKAFEGICLVDTFELAEERRLSLFTKENTARVKRQRDAPIFVIIGNPPYNAGQVNENDNNKNRKYPEMDRRVAETYARDSEATLVNQLSDPYVKSIRFASDRLGDEGVVAFVTNSSFVDGIAFDGMRKHLAQDFEAVYILDLGGNVRKNPKLSGTTHNVFGIQVGVSINFFVRKKIASREHAKIYYACVDEFWRKEQKYDFLDKEIHRGNIEWEEITPDAKHTWLTEGMSAGFETCLPMGTKEGKKAERGKEETIFKIYSRGICSNEDAYVYNHDRTKLIETAQGMVENYSSERDRWIRKGQPKNLEDFLNVDEKVLKWIRHTKRSLLRGREAEFDDTKIRNSLYRPFCQQSCYFERIFNEDIYHFPRIFPTPKIEAENQVICLSAVGNTKPFHCLMTNVIPDLHLTGDSQCFPFYTYKEDGGNRRENITDWALEQFRAQYQDDRIAKWDIFHYVYAVLHHPKYRERYAANLRRALPRIPFAPEPSSSFWEFAEAGAKLAEWHVRYEDQEEYPLKWMENKDVPLNWRVEKMRLSKDKTQLIYNDFLTFADIPPEVFEYRLGNRSALEWIVDQYRVKSDKRSGLVNDPNRPDDAQYIVRLIGKVITVSLETVKIVRGLPGLA